MGWVRLSVASASKKKKVLDAELVAPGNDEPSAWLRPNDPLPPGPFALFPAKGPDVDLEKGVAWANAIDVDSVFIVRKSLTEKIFAPLVEAGEVVLRPARVYRAHPSKRLGWTKGILDDDFVFVDVRARFPADRAKQDDASYSSLLKWVPSVDFGKDRAPRFSIFRVGDESSVLLASTALFAALKKALGDAIEEAGSGPRFFFLDASSSPPFPPGDGKAAADAFYRMYRANESSSADRKAALTHPIWAYWLALLVDRGPSDDTRAAACKHPFFAYAYARDVDRAPHAATRKAVSKNGDAAREYAVHVDRAVHPSLRDALSYHAADVEIRATANAKRFAEKPAPAALPVAAATTATEEYQRLVFAPDGRGVVLGSLRVAGGELYAPFDPPTPGTILFVADEYGGKGRLRKQKSLAHLGALRDGNYGPIIVRKSAVASLAKELGDEVALRPCVLHDDRGELDDDFAILDVRTYVPLDPIASDVQLAHAKAPWTGGVHLVHRFAWKTKPSARIFRVCEFPYVLLADTKVCAALAKATARAVRGASDAPTAEQMTPLVAPPKKPPADEAKAAAAMSAFYAGDRKGALAHPKGALAVALAERKPSADTRKAVLASPREALAYALFVDRGPRPDTRTAAAKTSDTAYRYARHVDIALTPATKKALDRKQWSEADIESFAEELAARRAALKL